MGGRGGRSEFGRFRFLSRRVLFPCLRLWLTLRTPIRFGATVLSLLPLPLGPAVDEASCSRFCCLSSVSLRRVFFERVLELTLSFSLCISFLSIDKWDLLRIRLLSRRWWFRRLPFLRTANPRPIRPSPRREDSKLAGEDGASEVSLSLPRFTELVPILIALGVFSSQWHPRWCPNQRSAFPSTASRG